MRPDDRTTQAARAHPELPSPAEIAERLAAADRAGVAAVSIAVPAPLVPPAALLALRESTPVALWAPSGGPVVAGLGAARRLVDAGGSALSSARALLEDLPAPGECRTLATGGAAPVPLRAFAGGAFDPARPGSWPRSLAVLPRFFYRSGASSASLAALALAGDRVDPETIARGLFALRDRLGAIDRDLLDEAAASADADPDERAAWERVARGALDEIDAGRAEKIVLARAVRVPLAPGPAAARLASRLGDRRPSDTLAALADDDHAIVAATPETLVRLVGDDVTADALAGTRASGEAHRLGPKERREQRAVVRAVREALATLGVRLEADEPPRPAPVTGAVHLRTVVRGRLTAARTVVDLADALHPTPAVAGTPRERALAWLAAHEPSSRGWYAGPFGWFDGAGDGHFVVLLRGAMLEGSEAVAWAGAGLVPGSEPAAEYDETALKLAPVLAALGVEP